MTIRKVRKVEALKTLLCKIRHKDTAEKCNSSNLLPTYYFVEHFFAGHIHGFTIMEHGTFFGGNPKTQSISEILCHQKSYFLI